MWKISEFTQKTRAGEKIRELNDLSPPEHPPILTHADTQTEGNHSTPLSVYIRNVLHTRMTVLCRIFSSEVMVEAADSWLADFFFFVYLGHLMLFFPLPGQGQIVLSYVQTLRPSSAWCRHRSPRKDPELRWVKLSNAFVPLCWKSLHRIGVWYWYPGLRFAFGEHPLILLLLSLCLRETWILREINKCNKTGLGIS